MMKEWNNYIKSDLNNRIEKEDMDKIWSEWTPELF